MLSTFNVGSEHAAMVTITADADLHALYVPSLRHPLINFPDLHLGGSVEFLPDSFKVYLPDSNAQPALWLRRIDDTDKPACISECGCTPVAVGARRFHANVR